jgi:hypothetical protein
MVDLPMEGNQMSSEQNTLKVIHNPDKSVIGDSVASFLQNIAGPTALFLSGKDASRTRVVCTLLHGNEPSGVHAIYNYLA